MTWLDRISKYYATSKIDPAIKYAEDCEFKSTEVGMTHPHTRSLLKLRDDGSIDLFAGDAIGLNLNPHTKAITGYANTFSISSNMTQIEAKELELNGSIFNQDYRVWQEVVDNDKYKRNFVQHASYEQYDEKLGWITLSYNRRPYLKNISRELAREYPRTIANKLNIRPRV